MNVLMGTMYCTTTSSTIITTTKIEEDIIQRLLEQIKVELLRNRNEIFTEMTIVNTSKLIRYDWRPTINNEEI